MNKEINGYLMNQTEEQSKEKILNTKRTQTWMSTQPKRVPTEQK